MTTTYELTEADVRSFIRHYYGGRRYWRGFLHIMILCAVVNTALMYLRRPDQWIALAIAFLVPVVLLGVAAPLLKPLFLGFASRISLRDGTPKGMLGKHDVTLEVDNFRERSGAGEQVVPWRSVHLVEQAKEHLYIYVAPACAHIIPVRAFSTPEEARTFLQSATDRWTRACATE